MGLYSLKHVISHRLLGYNGSYVVLKICLLKEEIRVFKFGGSTSGITSTSLPLCAALSKNISISCWEEDSKQFVNREVFCIHGCHSLDFRSMYTLLPYDFCVVLSTLEIVGWISV